MERIIEFYQEKSIERTNIIRDELLQKVLHPKRIQTNDRINGR